MIHHSKHNVIPNLYCTARIVSNTNRYSRIFPVRKVLHWLPVEQRSIFKTMTLVYKFLHAGVPKYFGPYISPQQSVYNTRRNQNQGSYLVVPKFHSSSHRSAKQFGHSFAFDAPTLWNSLPDDVRGSLTLWSFRKKLKAFLFFPRHIHHKPYPTGCLHGADFQLSLDIPFVLCFCFLLLRFCLSAEIKHYKSFN